MHECAPTLPPPEVIRRNGDLFEKDRGEIELERIAATKSVYLDQEYASPGVLFEPLKERKKGFLYGSFMWCEGDDSEVIVMFTTHRVILRGKRLDHLPEDFTGQKVRRVCVLGRADAMLSENAETKDVKAAIVSEIKIDRLNEDGQAEE
jgi:hypothetical protein